MTDVRPEKVRRARKMSIDERMMEGLQLFDRCLSLMRDGIRAASPEFTDEQVEKKSAADSPSPSD